MNLFCNKIPMVPLVRCWRFEQQHQESRIEIGDRPNSAEDFPARNLRP